MELNKQDELKMFQIYRKDEGSDHSLVFKISRSFQDPSFENPAFSSLEKSDPEHILRNTAAILVSEGSVKSLSPDFESALSKESQGLEISVKKDTESASSLKTETPDSSINQTENKQELRRSLRLLVLQSKINSSQGSDCKKPTSPNECASVKIEESLPSVKKRRLSNKFMSLKIEDYVSTDKNESDNQSSISVARKKSKMNKQTKDPSSSSFSTPATNDKRFTSSQSNIHPTHPSQMRLKSMLIIPNSSKPYSPATTSASESLYNISTPKFANVDPSRILSTLGRQGSALKEPVAIFFKNNDELKSRYTLRSQDNIPKESVYLHYFKKTKKDMSYLRKKYHMLDHITLDNCYGKVLNLQKLLR